MDMILLSLRSPTKFIRTDASEKGLGGYSLTSGSAWRFQVPFNLNKYLHTNYLEPLACVILIGLLNYQHEISPGTCICTGSDNCSAVAWMERTNLLPNPKTSTAPFHLTRFLALRPLEHDVCFFTDWIEDTANSVADTLPRSYPYHTPANPTNTIPNPSPLPDPVAKYVATHIIPPPPNPCPSWSRKHYGILY